MIPLVEMGALVELCAPGNDAQLGLFQVACRRVFLSRLIGLFGDNVTKINTTPSRVDVSARSKCQTMRI